MVSASGFSSKALALPGVKAVLTANDLKPLKLHWMPTLAGDVQAVLADEKVLSFLAGATPKKVIVVPGRLVNLVV